MTNSSLRYLTKSRFKLALECLTKLYYSGKKDEYADQNIDDPFLMALADGGYQVGELTKYLFVDDPITENITVDTLDYEEALRITGEKLKERNAVVAEAAFRHKNLFVRCDIVVKKGEILHIFEVKAKSTDGTPEFMGKKGIKAEWEEYLYDIAFQKYVAGKSYKNVFAHLVLVDKSAIASVSGLNTKFRVIRNASGRVKAITPPGLKKADLGAPLLIDVPVNDIVDEIINSLPVPTDYGEEISFEKFVEIVSIAYTKDERIYTDIGKKCRGCEFYAGKDEDLKSGFHECWKKQTKLSVTELEKPLVLELWAGKAGPKSLHQELIDSKIYLLKDAHYPEKPSEGPGISANERRRIQIKKVRENDTTCFIDKKGLRAEMGTWKYPLHMIDFETSMTPLPFFKGMHPYQGIAFQFSHHLIEKDKSVRHAGQYLSFKPGVFPNFEFVRELKKQLEGDAGTIFRYHNHENTYLNMICGQLETFPNAPADKTELITFIRSITRRNDTSARGKIFGPRDMVDLYDLVLKYYYSPFAKGSNSIKQILPGVIRDSAYLRKKYSKPVYGKNKEVKSLNFDEHIWIREDLEWDPYKTLPKVFAEYEAETLDKLVEGMQEIADGGSAMIAYNYLQFSDVPVDQRARIADSLLRYCELDTMAMVMIVEGWREMVKG